MFKYDDRFNNKIVENIINGSFSKYSNIIDLEHILKDLNKLDLVQDLELTIKNTKKTKPILEKKLSEIHCVAISFYETKVLIGKRKANKELLPNVWDFGCAKMGFKDTFQDAIKRDYKTDFNVDLILEENDLTPIATYTIEKSSVSGVIFVAKIHDISILKSNKHSESKMLDIAEVKDFINNNETIPNFESTINKAYELFIKKF